MADWGCDSDGQVPLSFSVGGTEVPGALQSTAQSCVTKSSVTTGSSGCRRHLSGRGHHLALRSMGVSALMVAPHKRMCLCSSLFCASIAFFRDPGWGRRLSRGLRHALWSVLSSILLAHMLLVPTLGGLQPLSPFEVSLTLGFADGGLGVGCTPGALGGCEVSPEGEMPASCCRQAGIVAAHLDTGCSGEGPHDPAH